MAKFLRKPKRNMAMRLAGVLFCLTLVSLYMVSGLFARYMTRGQGSDSARVIKFGEITLEEDGDFYDEANGLMWIVPGKDIQKKATVSFAGSEVATFVFVEVQLSEHWTYAEITEKDDDDNEVKKYTFTMAGGKISWTVADGWKKLGDDNVFYRELVPNETLTEADIIKDGIITVSDGITRGTMAALTTPITVTFRASVVQGNGFENATEAWGSLSGKGVGV